MKIIVMQKR